ncbi:MAG: AMP-binding protein, partial [Pseudomonadales bacterium]
MDVFKDTTENAGADTTAGTVIDVVRDLVLELHPSYRFSQPLDLDTRLDRDLGLDSLAMTELILRLERDLHVTLRDEALLAETPRDLLREARAGSGTESPAAMGEVIDRRAEETLAFPSHAQTLIDVLDWHTNKQPGRTHVYLYEGNGAALEISYSRLQEQAKVVAAGLRREHLQAGQSVALMLPTGQEYLFSFFGILMAGGVPVPIYPPARISQIEQHLKRHARILDNAEARILITVPEAKRVARLLRSHLPHLDRLTTVEELSADEIVEVLPIRRPGDIAFLQYTSGSTGDPKGVILTHANLLASIRTMVRRARATSRDTFVSWLPLYHDMGLIGAWLASLYIGAQAVLLSPQSFLAKPARWLWAIHRHRGTLTASPNFGYELCLRKIADAALEDLDLSSLKIAYNGAEPVSPKTLKKFNQRFARYGLDKSALTPVYGLAEASLGVAIPPPGRPAVFDRVQRDIFMRSGRAEPAPAEDVNALRWVGCGYPLHGEQVRIVDETGNEIPERQEGRLEFKGPSATAGYFRNPEATRLLFRHDDWLDSGDRGYIADGEVFITGRDKDVIVRGGRNILPYELDEAVGQITGIRKGCVASFGSREEHLEIERLVIVAETHETEPTKLARLHRDILDTTVDILSVPPDDVVLVPPHTIPKTSSGKLRRTTTCQLYKEGRLGHKRTVRWQIARVIAAGIVPRLRAELRRVGSILYSAYARALFHLLAGLAWIAVLLLPKLPWRWRWVRAEARLLAKLTGNRIVVVGTEQLPRDQAFVLASNHQSYLDSFALAIAIPTPLRFVAKSELLKNVFVRFPLRRLGT